VLEYSVRIGIGIDITLSFSETLRFDFDFLDSDDEELQLACDEAAVKFPRDAAADKQECRRGNNNPLVKGVNGSKSTRRKGKIEVTPREHKERSVSLSWREMIRLKKMSVTSCNILRRAT